MLSTRLPDKAYPTPYLLIMAHTLIYIVCIQQRSSLSLVESKLPLLADKDVSPSAHTELLRSASCGFASVENEKGDHGKGKFEIGRTQGLHRTCRVAISEHSCHWHPGTAHAPTSGSTYWNLHFLFSLLNCPSSFWFSCVTGEMRRSMITSSICSNFTSQDLPGLCFPWLRVYFPFCHFRLSPALREYSFINCNEISAG